MTVQKTYRIEERSTAPGATVPINVIPGLEKAVAEQLATVLRSGSAYAAGERECVVVVELTQAELLAMWVGEWRATGAAATSTAQLRAALQATLADLEQLGDQPLPATHIAVHMRVDDVAAAADDQVETVQVLAEVLQLETDNPNGGAITTPAAHPVRVMTAAHLRQQPVAPRRAHLAPPSTRRGRAADRPVSAPPAPSGGAR